MTRAGDGSWAAARGGAGDAGVAARGCVEDAEAAARGCAGVVEGAGDVVAGAGKGAPVDTAARGSADEAPAGDPAAHGSAGRECGDGDPAGKKDRVGPMGTGTGLVKVSKNSKSAMDGESGCSAKRKGGLVKDHMARYDDLVGVGV